MPRSTNNPATRKRRNRVLKRAKGFFLGRKNYRQAKETVMRGLVFAFRDRKARKREFRSLWVVRMNAACKANGITYSRFIDGLKKAKIGLDRKSLADIALNDPKAFTKLVELVKKS